MHFFRIRKLSIFFNFVWVVRETTQTGTFKVHGTTAISAACQTHPTPKKGREEQRKETEKRGKGGWVGRKRKKV